MDNYNKSFMSTLSQTNIMSDGMLQGISYGDYALLMVTKDKPNKDINKLVENKRKKDTTTLK